MLQFRADLSGRWILIWWDSYGGAGVGNLADNRAIYLVIRVQRGIDALFVNIGIILFANTGIYVFNCTSEH